MDDHRLLRRAGLALPAAVWVLGIFSPPREGLTPEYLASFSALLVGLAAIDQSAPRADAPLWRRLLWLGAEVLVCWLVVRVHGTLIRPALIYLLPASRSLLMFGERRGLVLSLSVWLAYGINVGSYAWPDRLVEYPNYLSFFLAPYVLAVVLTLAIIRQSAGRRRLQTLYDELRAAHEQLQSAQEQARELAVAHERNRLAREIHDSLAHYLTVINVELEAADKLSRLGPDQADRALEEVRRARRLTVECLQEVRRSVAALRAASSEELSLPTALKRLAAEFAEGTGIKVHLDVLFPEDELLAPETALALYRAAQEGLTNVQRHANAANVQLALSKNDGNLELAVQDDGQSPGQPDADGQSGFGLLGLRERVELLGGRLQFGRGPEGGARLVVLLPAREA
jgi:signal transduction histidine kinase